MNEKNVRLRCPRCKNQNIIDYDKIIECPVCHLHFFKKYIGKMKDEDILAIEELEGFGDSF